jgi:hypothetical protein
MYPLAPLAMAFKTVLSMPASAAVGRQVSFPVALTHHICY